MNRILDWINKNKVKSVFIVFALLLVLGAVGKVTHANSVINKVKEGYFDNYPGTQIGEAFDNYLGDEEWTYVKEDGKEYVVVTGDLYYDGVLCEAVIKFYIQDGGERFNICSVKINEIEQDVYFNAVLVDDIMTGDIY